MLVPVVSCWCLWWHADACGVMLMPVVSCWCMWCLADACGDMLMPWCVSDACGVMLMPVMSFWCLWCHTDACGVMLMPVVSCWCLLCYVDACGVMLMPVVFCWCLWCHADACGVMLMHVLLCRSLWCYACSVNCTLSPVIVKGLTSTRYRCLLYRAVLTHFCSAWKHLSNSIQVILKYYWVSECVWDGWWVDWIQFTNIYIYGFVNNCKNWARFLWCIWEFIHRRVSIRLILK